MQVTIPEIGSIRAKSTPFVVLTSNRTRPLSEALRRRCAYLYLQYPDVEKEVSIIRAKLPHVNEHLAVQVAQAVHDLRENDAILKKPSIAETLDWVSALVALGVSTLTPEAMEQTRGFVLKNNEDFSHLPQPSHHACSHHHGHGHTCGDHTCNCSHTGEDEAERIARAQQIAEGH